MQYLVAGGLNAMDDRFVLMRSDTEEALSVVSGDYQVVRPKEILEFYRDLVQQCGYSLETAGALNGGRKVWALAKTGLDGSVGEDGQDRLAAYLLLATSCDKTLATTVAFTSIRAMCQNTLSFAANDVKSNKRLHVKVPHNLRFDAEQIEKSLGLIDVAWSGFIKQVHRMTRRQLRLTPLHSFSRKCCAKVNPSHCLPNLDASNRSLWRCSSPRRDRNYRLQRGRSGEPSTPSPIMPIRSDRAQIGLIAHGLRQGLH